MNKLDPTRSMYLRGFDRRGCVASLHTASSTGFTVSGYFSDIADFVVMTLFDADDLFGHLYTSKYLPDFDLSNVTMTFDLATTNCQNPTSWKFPSIPWNALSYIKQDGTSGTVPLNVISSTGALAATTTYTVNGVPVAFDRIQLIYLSNIVFDVIYPSGSASITYSFFNSFGVGYNHFITIGANTYSHVQLITDSSTDIAIALAAAIASDPKAFAAQSANNVILTPRLNDGTSVACSASDGNGAASLLEITNSTDYMCSLLVTQINSFNYVAIGAEPLIAVQTSNTFTLTAGTAGRDGNSICLLEFHKTGTAYLTPAGLNKLTGGIDPTSITIAINFGALSPLRQAWLTIAPTFNYDSGAGTPTMAAYAQSDFSYVVSNIVITDPSTVLPLYVANPTSLVLNSHDALAQFTGTWGVESGFYYHGLAKASSLVGSKVIIRYSFPYTHDLYLGTALYVDRAKFGCKLDGAALADVNCYLNVASQVITRRKLTTAVAAGEHTLELTVKSGTGTICYFDYLNVVVPSAPTAPAISYTNISAAADFDTDQTYKISPARLLFIYQQLGYLGDLDFYRGVFFSEKRQRRGGTFHAAVITVAGTLNYGTDFGDGDQFFVVISGTSLGVSVFSQDTLDTIIYRFVDAINTLFVGIRAARTASGQLTITCLSPINGFSLTISSTTLSGATWTKTGDINAGNEGIWEIANVASPLNKAFVDYFTDFCNLFKAAGIPFVIASSQELLAPPDANTSVGAWIQRYNDGSLVLTATGFGTWGSGYVEAITGTGPYVIKQTGHGYIDGYFVHFAGGPARLITYIDADHYSVTVTPSVGNLVNADLQTSQCAFNPNTVTVYMTNVYKQMAAIMDACAITVPYVQFGEIFHWFFAGGIGPTMAFYDANQAVAALAALGRSLHVFTDPDNDPSVNAYADAIFLYTRIQTFVNTIVTAVKALYPNTKFEELWAYDVNYLTAYTNTTYPFYLGGRLNRYINLPPAYESPGSDIDRFKVEALAWGTSFRSLTQAIDSIQVGYSAPFTWPKSDLFYLIPWQNGGCPWHREYLQAVRNGLVNLNFWALDHAILFSWYQTLPIEDNYAGIT